MDFSPRVSEFGGILIFLLAGTAFILLVFLVSRMMRPHRPTAEKRTTYECGEDPVGNARIQMNIRFYIVALIFLIFDVEIVFLYPWSTVFADEQLIQAAPEWGWLGFTEAMIFIFVLTMGLVYAWLRGYLDWIRPEQLPPLAAGSKVPADVYQRVNERYGGRGKR